MFPVALRLGTALGVQLINDRYELLEVIASGGMATVWRARDTRLNRPVAVKRPHPAPPGDDAPERLGREARAAASLSHPNLITIYDFGHDETGPYLVMELVEGPTLHELGGELEPIEIADLGAGLAGALAAIHAAGIIHRDVKPANVIMSERGPLLTDFGIATDPDATKEITQPGLVLATPSFAAPEVLRGEQPTSASDVYSLGVLMDELVRKTGTTPDPWLDGAIAAALAESPQDRPDAVAFAESLGRVSPPSPEVPSEGTTMILETAPPAPTTPVGRPEDDDRAFPMWIWIAGALVLLALGLTALGLAMSADDPPAEAAVASTSLAADDSTSTSSPSTTTTTSSSTTTTIMESPGPGVTAARDELEAVLSRPPRSNLNPPEVEDIMTAVDEGIEAAMEGDLDTAEEKFVETERRLEEELEDEKLDDARSALRHLADLLGVEMDDDDGDDDDDDDDD